MNFLQFERVGRADNRGSETRRTVGRRLAGAVAMVLAIGLWSGAGAICGMAQSGTDGAIGGTVMDAAGQPVSGALVLAQELETGLTTGVRSGAKGEFLVVRLPVGEYAVSVAHAGLVLTLQGSVKVALGEVTEVAAKMQQQTAGAKISGGSGRGGGSPSIGEHELGVLPVYGGQWSLLALTEPGANEATEDNAASEEVSFRGVAETQNSTRTDGTSSDEGFSGARAGAGIEEQADAASDSGGDRASGVGSGERSVTDGGRRAGSSYTFAQAAVREFRVQGQADAATYGSALYGHGVGGVVTTVSRSGGSTMHGLAFYTIRDSAWAAVDPFALESSYVNGLVSYGLVRPSDVRQQFGGRIGGPISFAWMKGQGDRGMARSHGGQGQKLFYFYAFDAQRRKFPAISSPGYAGFYALTGTQTALLGNRGVTPAKTMAALNYLDSLTGTVARRADQTVNFGRLDWHPRAAMRVVGEYNRARWSEPAGVRSGSVVDRGAASLGSSYGAVDLGVLRWVTHLRGGLSNEVRVQYGRQLQYEVPQTPLPQEPSVGPGGLVPEVSIGPDGFVYGTPAALGQRAYPDEKRLEVANVMAWVRGRHLLQFGGDFSWITDYTDSLTNAEGTFSYDSGATNGKAGGLVDWITDYTFGVNAYPTGGCPSITAALHYFCFRSFTQSFGEQSVSFSTQEWAGFVQEDWRLAPRLTIHAGLRYEYEFLPLPQQPNRGLDAVFGAVGATSVYPEDRNNLGPRLGAAWEPFGVGRGVIRAGWGVYFGKLPGATVRAALENTAQAGTVTQIRIVPTTGTLCPQMPMVSFGYACSYLTPPVGVAAATTSTLVFDRRFRMPEVQQGTLTVEHGVGWGVVASAGYVVNLDRQLPNSVDINIIPSTGTRTFQLQGGTGAAGVRDGETFVVPVYTARVSTNFGPVTDLISNANAFYHGFTLEARRAAGAGRGSRRAGRGLEFRVGWTWSKATDFGQNAGAVPKINGQFDPFNVRYDKGFSALNFPHRVVGTVVWTPRFDMDRKPGVRLIANGWSVAGIFSEGSGRGYSYDIFGGTLLAGGHESINGSGGSVVLPTVGRNTLRLPDRTNLDVRLTRSFELGRSGLRLLAAVEAFNVANHLNYSGVQQRAFLVGSPGTGTTAAGVTPLIFQDASTVAAEGLNVQPFGTYTAAGTGQARERQVQAGLKLEF